MLQDVILKKSLLASDFQITILIFLTSSAFLFSIYGTEIINRSNNQSRTIIGMAVFSRMFLLIIPFFETPNFFIFCIAAMSYTDSLIKPSWNTVFKHNYTDAKRSVLYSYASSLYTIVVLIVTTLLGYLLDLNYELYKVFYPMAGIFDILAYINLAKMIKMGKLNVEQSKNKFTGVISKRLLRDILILPVRNLIRIFKENRPFFRFEIFLSLWNGIHDCKPCCSDFFSREFKVGLCSDFNCKRFSVLYCNDFIYTIDGKGSRSR